MEIHSVKRRQLWQLLRRRSRPENSHGRYGSDKVATGQPRTISAESVRGFIEMPTTITEPAADVVILGVGYMSGVIAAELSIASLNGGKNYKVVAITKGPYWDYVNDFSTTKYDEWGVGLGRKYDSPLPLQSATIRNTPYQFALPVRR